MTVTYIKKTISSELDTHQGEGNMGQLQFAAKQLSNNIQVCMSQGSDEYSELPTTAEHIKMLMNQIYGFHLPPQAAA